MHILFSFEKECKKSFIFVIVRKDHERVTLVLSRLDFAYKLKEI